eukprot:953201-Pleurochrysis_carterae.AAC.1
MRTAPLALSARLRACGRACRACARRHRRRPEAQGARSFAGQDLQARLRHPGDVVVAAPTSSLRPCLSLPQP